MTGDVSYPGSIDAARDAAAPTIRRQRQKDSLN
jgi:hypothetical protein